MRHRIEIAGGKRRRVAAFAVALALAWPHAVHADAAGTDYALNPVRGAALELQNDRMRKLEAPSERVAPTFQFLFGAPTKWPGAVHWRYNHADAPAQLAGSKVAAIEQLVGAAAKWTAACGVQIVYGGETTAIPNAQVDGRVDEQNVVGWRVPDGGYMGATYSWFDADGAGDNALVDSDIALSPASVTSLPQLAMIAAHEWGHAIGLGHSNVGNVLMSGPPDTAYTAIADLTADDVHACRCLYGPPAGQQAGSMCSLPEEIDFGALDVGATAGPRQVTVSNDGDAAMVITGIRTGGSEFLVDANSCRSGAALAPGASCIFTVNARPANIGRRGDEVTIDTSEGPHRIPVRATGIAASPAGANFDGLWSAAPADSESGWGINLAHQGDTIFATWFTYDSAGRAWWLTMSATRGDDDVYRGTLYETHGPSFNAVPFDPNAVTYRAVGAASLSFGGTNSGTFAYTVNGLYQTKAISRVTFGPLPVCTFGVQPNLALAKNYQDAWWVDRAAESGWGVNFTQQGDIIFVTWFTYDFDGTPLWLSATAPRIAPGVFGGTLYRTTGPAFGATPFNPRDVVRTPVGNLTLTFVDGNNATFAYTVTLGTPPVTVTQAKQLTRLVFRAPGTVCQ